jgi:hypothetical protein
MHLQLRCLNYPVTCQVSRDNANIMCHIFIKKSKLEYSCIYFWRVHKGKIFYIQAISSDITRYQIWMPSICML